MSEFIVIKDHGMGFFEVSNCAGATYGMFNLEVTAQRLRDQLNAGLAAQAEIERLRAENERLKVGHDRYEILRKMNVVQFQGLYKQNIEKGIPFDELVDLWGGL